MAWTRGWGGSGWSAPAASALLPSLSFLPRSNASLPNATPGWLSTLQWERTQAWSVICNIKVATPPDSLGAAIIFTTVNEGASGPLFAGYEFWINDAGQLQVRILSDFAGNNYLGQVGTTNVCDSVWHTVAATYDGSSTAAGVNIYVDGVLETMAIEHDGLFGTIINKQPFLIGNQLGWPYSLGGSMSQFSLSNVVRSGATIAAYTTALAAVDANTILAYAMTTGSGGSLTDLSGNGFTGRIHNATWQDSSAGNYQVFASNDPRQCAIGPNPQGTFSATYDMTFSTPVRPGNAVMGCVVVGVSGGVTINSITDDQSNVYTIVDTDTSLANVCFVTFYRLNVTNSPTVITATLSSGTGNFWRGLAEEVSGIAITSALDGHSAAYNSSVSGTDSMTSGSATTTRNGDMIWAGSTSYTANLNAIAGTGFNALDGDAPFSSGIFSEFRLQATAGSVASTFTPSTTALAHVGMLCFKPPLAINFTDHAENNAANTTETWSSKAFAIGAAEASRLVVATLTVRFTSVLTINSVTIGGVAATKVTDANQLPGTITSMWQAAVPTGTTATISAVFSGASIRAGVTVNTVLGSSGVVPSGGAIATQVNTATPTVGSVTVTVPTGGGALIAAGYSQGNAVAVTSAATNYTENLTATSLGSQFIWQETGTDFTAGSRTYTVHYSTIGISGANAALTLAAAYGP